MTLAGILVEALERDDRGEFAGEAEFVAWCMDQARAERVKLRVLASCLQAEQSRPA